MQGRRRISTGEDCLEQTTQKGCKQEDSKDKDFELELTWISGVNGPTKGRHEEVPKALKEEAERLAKEALELED